MMVFPLALVKTDIVASVGLQVHSIRTFLVRNATAKATNNPPYRFQKRQVLTDLEDLDYNAVREGRKVPCLSEGQKLVLRAVA